MERFFVSKSDSYYIDAFCSARIRQALVTYMDERIGN